MKSDKNEALKKRFFEHLCLTFSRDAEAQCNQDSLAKIANYIQSKLTKAARAS
jgi:hypothetical protein